MTEHRQGVDPGFLIKHRLNLAGTGLADIGALVAEIDELPCVDQVQFDKGKQQLKIAYDASHHNIDEMIGIVEKYGGVLKDSWWNRARLNWQRQTDENIRNNATHEAHCCSKPPAGYHRNREVDFSQSPVRMILDRLGLFLAERYNRSMSVFLCNPV